MGALCVMQWHKVVKVFDDIGYINVYMYYLLMVDGTLFIPFLWDLPVYEIQKQYKEIQITPFIVSTTSQVSSVAFIS